MTLRCAKKGLLKGHKAMVIMLPFKQREGSHTKAAYPDCMMSDARL
jgi:hypothetical protein